MSKKGTKMANYNAKPDKKRIEHSKHSIEAYTKNMQAMCLHQDENGAAAVPYKQTTDGVTYNWVCPLCGEPLLSNRISKEELNKAVTTIITAIDQSKQSLQRKSIKDMEFAANMYDVIKNLPLVREYYSVIYHEGGKKGKKGGIKKAKNIRLG
jgi:hypothetical protein